ncbi:hypothetical protein DFH06DRAFT_986261 [Mycena polygramma]|nr:hypothetical protein DFH06DRAFT_986261 [Mycena polygramma]
MAARAREQDDPVREFLVHSDRIMRDARFVVDSLPNAEIFAVERSLRQLNGIHYVLLNLDDPWLSRSDNIRMERGWRDVRKDTLEFFREIFMYLEANGLLDMENPVHRVCLFVVFQPRIQKSLDETTASWNLHKVRTAGNKTPLAIFQLSREKAINRGYWTGDPGDDINTASDPTYGQDPEAPLPPLDEMQNDPAAPDYAEYPDVSAEREAGILINDDEEVQECKDILSDMDLMSEDGNWGIDHYCQAVLCVTEYFMNQS